MARLDVLVPDMPSIPGLNTRETSLVVWAGVFLAYAVTRAEVRSSFGSLLKLIVRSAFLSAVILSAIGWAAGTVLLLQRVGYWETGMTKTAALWFLGIAIVAIFNTKRTDARYFRRLLLDNLALAAVVEFVVNLHTFPLLVELVLVPLALMFVAMDAYSEGNPELASARKLIGWCLTLLGLTAISFSLSYITSHFDEVATSEKVKEFVLPLILTTCFLPYLYALRMVTVWQTMLHMIRFGLHGNEQLFRFTRREVIRSCGVSLGRAQLFEEKFRGRLWGATEEQEVEQAVADFRRAWASRRSRAGEEPVDELAHF